MADYVVTDNLLIDFSEERVLLNIGPEMLQWSILRSHLERSRLFRTMLKQQWLKSKPRKLELPDIDPRVLRAYLHFLSTNKIPALGQHTLAELYVYGEQISDIGFKNAALTAISEQVTHSSRTSSPLAWIGGLMVDIYYTFAERWWEVCHEEFMLDLARKRVKELEGRPDWLEDLVAARFQENRDERKTGARQRWHASHSTYHETCDPNDATLDVAIERQEESEVDRAISCKDRRSTKRQLSDPDRGDDCFQRSLFDPFSVPQAYKYHKIMPGTYFPTGA